MKPSRLAAAGVCLVVLLAACASPGGRQPAQLPPANESQQQLRKLLQETWGRERIENAFLRLQLGLPVRRLPDLSFEKAAEEADYARSVLERSEEIDPLALSEDERTTLDLLQYELRKKIEGMQHFWLTSPITPYASVIPKLGLFFTGYRLSSSADLEGYIYLLRKHGRLLGQALAHLRGQAEMGIVLPADAIDGILPLLDALAQPPERSQLQVAPERLPFLSAAEAEAFRTEVAKAIEEEINPRYRAISELLTRLRPHRAPREVGLWQYPGGEAYYAYLVRYHTTLDVTPQQVHERGLAEVARLERAMDRLQRLAGSPASRREYLRSLRENRQFRATKAEEIGERMQGYLARIEPLVPKLFRSKPAAPYGVARLAPSLEGTMTYGYYQQPTPADGRGTYFYNGSNPSQRPLLQLQSVIYHELIPGHHFQIARQFENKALPGLRRFSMPTAFVEGWAEYASGLGEELQLYSDPNLQYGRYAAEMFLAVRLVVDTGMNHLRWSRRQAIEYMQDRVLESDTQIATETLRYSTDIPAQALAYKMGALEIWALRRRAEAELGERFDVRDFHEVVLDGGALPLPLLETRVDSYIARTLARPVSR